MESSPCSCVSPSLSCSASSRPPAHCMLPFLTADASFLAPSLPVCFFLPASSSSPLSCPSLPSHSVLFHSPHSHHPSRVSAALFPLFDAHLSALESRRPYSTPRSGLLPLLSKALFSSSSSNTPSEPNKYKLPPVNPPDSENPDAATLREQWNNAVRLYTRLYSHAWGTAILAGVTCFGIGWWIKGGNPLAPDPKKEVTE